MKKVFAVVGLIIVLLFFVLKLIVDGSEKKVQFDSHLWKSGNTAASTRAEMVDDFLNKHANKISTKEAIIDMLGEPTSTQMFPNGELTITYYLGKCKHCYGIDMGYLVIRIREDKIQEIKITCG